jgi:hypothetical protein
MFAFSSPHGLYASIRGNRANPATLQGPERIDSEVGHHPSQTVRKTGGEAKANGLLGRSAADVKCKRMDSESPWQAVYNLSPFIRHESDVVR